MSGDLLSSKPSLHVGEWVGRRYQVLSLLGVGGMGEVYQVLHINTGRRFALKILRLHYHGHGDQFERMLREAAVTAQIEHENVVECTDCGFHEDSRPWLVMPLLFGLTLRQVIEAGPIPLAIACDYGAQIAAGLHAAHKRGVLHRDLKPSNVFVRETGQIKLVDFGLMKAVYAADVITEDGARIGTPAYMSPEQYNGDPIDHRTDVFALACIKYELMAGRHPFDGVPPGSVSFDPVPLPDLIPGFPARTWNVLARAFARNPKGRHASARELQTALREEQAFLEQTFSLDAFPTRLGRRIFIPTAAKSMDLPPISLTPDAGLVAFPPEKSTDSSENEMGRRSETAATERPAAMPALSYPTTPIGQVRVEEPIRDPALLAWTRARDHLSPTDDPTRVTVPLGTIASDRQRAHTPTVSVLESAPEDTKHLAISARTGSKDATPSNSTLVVADPSARWADPTDPSRHPIVPVGAGVSVQARATAGSAPFMSPRLSTVSESLKISHEGDPTIFDAQPWGARSGKAAYPPRKLRRFSVLTLLVASTAAASVEAIRLVRPAASLRQDAVNVDVPATTFPLPEPLVREDPFEDQPGIHMRPAGNTPSPTALTFVAPTPTSSAQVAMNPSRSPLRRERKNGTPPAADVPRALASAPTPSEGPARRNVSIPLDIDKIGSGL